MEAVAYLISAIVIVASFYWIRCCYKNAIIIRNKVRVSKGSGYVYQVDFAYFFGIAFACLHLVFVILGVGAAVSGTPLQKILSVSDNYLYFLCIVAMVGAFSTWGDLSRVSARHRPIYFVVAFVHARLALAAEILFS